MDKNASSEEKKLSKQQRTTGAIAHLSLQAMENYSTLYKKVSDLFMWYIGEPNTLNSEWTGVEDETHEQYIYSEGQNMAYAQFTAVQCEFQTISVNVPDQGQFRAGALTRFLQEWSNVTDDPVKLQAIRGVRLPMIARPSERSWMNEGKNQL